MLLDITHRSSYQLLLITLIMGLHGALYKPNMVGIRRDAPPEVGGSLPSRSSSTEESDPPPRLPGKAPQDLQGPSGSFAAEEPPTPRFSSQAEGAGRLNSDREYSRGLARTAPLAPPAGGPQSYIDPSAPSGPKSNPSSLYGGQKSPNEIIPAGYVNTQELRNQPSYNLPEKSSPPALTSYNSKPNPFTVPRSSQTNPYSPNSFPASPPKSPSNGQNIGNGYLTQPNQEYQQPNTFQQNQQSQQQPIQDLLPYGPTGPSNQNQKASGINQFNVPGTLSSRLDNSIPPPPGTNKNGGPANTLSNTPAFPAPFGFPESLKVGQNSPFKNLVSFNSPRPFKSRESAPFPDKGDIFGGFPSSNYNSPISRPTPAESESRPAAPANRPAYPVNYPQTAEAPNPYATAPRGSGQEFRRQDAARFDSRPAENPYFPQQRNSNPGYGFPSQDSGVYANPYGYSNAPNGQCFRYTYAAEGYRLSDIAKSYPEEAIKKELEQKSYLAPLVGLKVSPKKQQGFNNFFQFDYSGFGFNNNQNDAEKYAYLLNSKVYPGNFKQGDFDGGYPSSMRPLDTSCPSQEYKLRSFFHHGGDCYVANPEWQLITYNRCSRRECNFCGVNRGLSACVEDYRWFTVVAYCTKLEEGSRIVPLRLILPVGCTCQHFAC